MDALLGEFAEEALDKLQPRRGGRRRFTSTTLLIGETRSRWRSQSRRRRRPSSAVSSASARGRRDRRAPARALAHLRPRIAVQRRQAPQVDVDSARQRKILQGVARPLPFAAIAHNPIRIRCQPIVRLRAEPTRGAVRVVGEIS